MKQFSWVKIILIGMAFVLIMVVFNSIGQHRTKGFFYYISSPVQKIFWHGGQTTADWCKTIWEIRTLKEENERLLLENKTLVSANALTKEIEKENQYLRQTLEMDSRKDLELVLAQLISKDISQDYFLINKGEENGLVRNMPVITAQKVLVGKISEVYKNHSKVILISHPESIFDVTIQDKEIKGIIRGDGYSQIILDLIPQECDIQSGDAIVTTALGGISPEGLFIGNIKSITQCDIDPFKRAAVGQSFSAEQLSFLLVITEF